MKDTEVDNNALNESHEEGYDEHVRVENIGPEKRVYNVILLIMI